MLISVKPLRAHTTTTKGAKSTLYKRKRWAYNLKHLKLTETVIASCGRVEEEDLRVLNVMAETETLIDAAAKLGLSEGALAARIDSMRRKYMLPRGRYHSLVLTARLLTLCSKLQQEKAKP
jgi:predicted RecB family endonuclease